MPIIIPAVENTVANSGTLASVRTAISRLVERRDFYRGTATGGNAESVQDQNMLFETGHWTGAEIYFASGANSGLTATCSGSDVGVIMFSKLPNAVGIGDQYELRRFHTKSDVDSAIGSAIRDTWNQVWIPKQWSISVPTPYPGGISLMNTPPTTSPDMLPPAFQYVYTTRAEDPRPYNLPSDVVYLYSVQYLDDSNPPVLHTLRYNHWFSRLDGNIYIDADAWGSMNQTTIPTTLNGYRLPLIPVNDSDIIEVPTTYVIWQAAGMLKMQGFGSQAIDVSDETHDAASLIQMASAKLAQSRTYMKPNTRRMVV